jgi:hypothetical protein
MIDLKDRSAEWLKSNWSLVVITIALGLIAINDSWIGLGTYFLTIHFLCMSYAVGLFDDNYLSMDKIKAVAKENKTKMEGIANLAFFIVLSVTGIVILVIRDHWYLLVITIATVIFLSIHLVDGIQKIRKYKKEMVK